MAKSPPASASLPSPVPESADHDRRHLIASTRRLPVALNIFGSQAKREAKEREAAELAELRRRVAEQAAQDAIEQALGNIPNMPPETMEMIRGFATGPSLALLMVAITVPLYAVFGMLGALLGTAFFRKKATPDGMVGPTA